jgi:putative aldouronate transport system substrate-binding protein
MKQSRFRKLFIPLATVSLTTILLIAGCTNAPAPSNPSTPGNAAAPNQPTVEQRGKITSSVYDRGRVPASEGTGEDNRWTRWINENGPADVKFITVPRTESKQRFNTLFAAREAPDLILEYDTPYRNQLYAQGLLMPIGDLIEKHSTTYKKMLEDYPDLRKVGTKSDGKLYEVGRVLRLHPQFTLVMRADWLKNVNMEVPKTAKDLYKVMKAFVEQDPDQNGVKDTFGIALSGPGGEGGSGRIDDMFQNVEWVVENGKLIKDWDRVKAATEYKKRIFEERLVDRDYLTDSGGEKALQDWVNGKVGIFSWQHGRYDQFEPLKKNNPNAEVIVIALPETEFGAFLPSVSNPVQITGAVNANASDPVSVIKYLDFMVSESTATALEFGLEGVHWEKGPDNCPRIIDEKKYQQEVGGWMGDMRMLTSRVLFGDCDKHQKLYNPDNPLHKEFIELLDLSDKTYITADRSLARITVPEHMPELPQDLQLVVANIGNTIKDMWQRAIVSGSSYTPEHALKDAQATWNRAGGKRLEEFYANWYANERDTAFLAEDIFKYAK